jgi:hypothetical protein
MVDEQIDSDGVQLLEGLLLSDDQARTTYVDCIQLHTDLLTHFAKPETARADGKSPVLGFLGDGVPPINSQATT